MPVEKCALPSDRNSCKKLWSLTLVSFKIKDLPSSGFVIFKNCVKGPFPDLFRASRDGMRLKPTFGWLLGSGKCKSKGDDPWIEGLGFSTSQMFKGSGLFRYYWWSACFFCFVLFCFVLFFCFFTFFSASFGFTIKIWEGFRFEKIPRRCRRLLRNNEFVRYSSLIRVGYLLLFTEIESINFLCFGFRSKKSHVLMKQSMPQWGNWNLWAHKHSVKLFLSCTNCWQTLWDSTEEAAWSNSSGFYTVDDGINQTWLCHLISRTKIFFGYLPLP